MEFGIFCVHCSSCFDYDNSKYLLLCSKFLVFYCSSIKRSPSIFTGDVQGGFQDTGIFCAHCSLCFDHDNSKYSILFQRVIQCLCEWTSAGVNAEQPPQDETPNVFKCPLPVEKPVTRPTTTVPPKDSAESIPAKDCEQNVQCKFHEPQKGCDLENLSKCTFAANMECKVKWVLGIYCQWREHKLVSSDCDPRINRSDLYFPCKLQIQDVAYSLRLFLTEVQKLNSSEYPPCTLYQMVLCIQIYFEKNKVFWHL